MIVYKKAKSYQQARRIVEFLIELGYGAEVKKNQGFLSEKYSHHVVGNDEEVLGVIERHERVVNIVENEVKREATWNKPRSEWNNKPNQVRT